MRVGVSFSTVHTLPVGKQALDDDADALLLWAGADPLRRRQERRGSALDGHPIPRRLDQGEIVHGVPDRDDALERDPDRAGEFPERNPFVDAGGEDLQIV
jgi:hypothetical protein